MRIGFTGQIEEGKQVRAGVIGCGSHAFRNIYPTFQFTDVDLVATCDLDDAKARAFADAFGAERAYGDYREMISRDDIDAVFVVLPYDSSGRPMYPDIAVECLAAGKHVWIEKPPAASCADIERMQRASELAGKQMAVGLKKMFFPANEKAKSLIDGAEFGAPQLAMLQYPQHVPTVEEFAAYHAGEANDVVGFLDHICHPMSLLIYLLGMPDTLYYERSASGSGISTFTYADGAVATIAFTRGQSFNEGLERTTIVSDRRIHVTVENNTRVTFHRMPPHHRYGATPSFYTGGPGESSATWQPEFSLGNLYNKGLFLLGYYGEVNEFARAILEDRKVEKGTLDHARQITRVFEAFAEGPGKRIDL